MLGEVAGENAGTDGGVCGIMLGESAAGVAAGKGCGVVVWRWWLEGVGLVGGRGVGCGGEPELGAKASGEGCGDRLREKAVGKGWERGAAGGAGEEGRENAWGRCVGFGFFGAQHWFLMKLRLVLF